MERVSIPLLTPHYHKHQFQMITRLHLNNRKCPQNSKNTIPLIAQLVEHCTGITEVMGSTDQVFLSLLLEESYPSSVHRALRYDQSPFLGPRKYGIY